MNAISIRAATEADVPLLLQLIRGLAEFVKEPDAVETTEALLREGLFGARPYAEAAIASLDGTPCGMAIFFHTFSTWTGRPGLYLEDLFVTPEARGAGVGQALMRHLARLAHTRGCARFEWSVLDWNTEAIAFYDRLGAKPKTDSILTRLEGTALEQLAKEIGR